MVCCQGGSFCAHEGVPFAEILARREAEMSGGIRPLKGGVAVCHQRKVRCRWSPDRQEESPLRNRSVDGLPLSPSARERLPGTNSLAGRRQHYGEATAC